MTNIDAAKAEGAAAERARIAAILTSDEGQARPDAAWALALHSDLPAAAAIRTLAGLPGRMPAQLAAPTGPVTVQERAAAAARDMQR